jgi:glycine cleavage system transcriptional repressor
MELECLRSAVASAVRIRGTLRDREGESVRSWFLLSAVGRDRPGIVADLAQLIFDCEANLEDSRMTILGNEFAAILLCSGTSDRLEKRLSEGARRLEWENRLTVFIRPLEGAPRPPVPAPGTVLYFVRAEGEDRAGIVARICRVLADLHVNIADLHSAQIPAPSGAVLYSMSLDVEVPETLSEPELRQALGKAAAELNIDVQLERGA